MSERLKRPRPGEQHAKRQVDRFLNAIQSHPVPGVVDDETKRENAFDSDVALTRQLSRWHDSNSLKPKQVADQIIDEVDKWVKKFGVGSPEELKLFLGRLDTAASLSNDPKIQILRKKIAEKFTENIN